MRLATTLSLLAALPVTTAARYTDWQDDVRDGKFVVTLTFILLALCCVFVRDEFKKNRERGWYATAGSGLLIAAFFFPWLQRIIGLFVIVMITWTVIDHARRKRR